MEQPKQKRWKSEKYLKWIREQPCWYCDNKAEPHHLKGVGYMSGVGLKAPDWATVPMCRLCHSAFHKDSSLWPDQWEMIVRTLGKAISEGILVVK